MCEEHGFITYVERERDARHDVHGRIVVAECFRRQLIWIITGRVVVGLQPRCRVSCIHCEDVRVRDFGALGVVPGVSTAVTDNGAWVFQGVGVHGEVIADVVWNDVVAAELVDQRAADVAHAVRLSNNVGVFQDRLVGVESVDTQTHVEDDVVKREFVHDVARDVNRLVGANGTGVVPRIVGFGEEVFDGGAGVGLVPVRIVTTVRHQV